MNWIKKNWIWLLVNLVAVLPMIGVFNLFSFEFVNGSLQAVIDLPVRLNEISRGAFSGRSELWLPIHSTGEWAIRWLTLSLTITPFVILFGFKRLTRYRKLFGIYAFAYSLVHLLFFIADKKLIAVFDEFNFLLGMISFLIMLPLAITSNKRSIRIFRKSWKALHKWVYLAGVLAIFHVALIEDGSWAFYAVVVGLGLVLRLQLVRNAIKVIKLNIKFRQYAENV